MARTKPLVTRLRSARILLRDWRRTLVHIERIRSGPNEGTLPDDAARELARFDAADAALREAIAAVGELAGNRAERGLGTRKKL